MTKTNKSYNQLITELEENFLFQISLGSKELFHSNLLAWLMEQENKEGEPEVFKIFLKQFLDLEVADLSRESIQIRREWNKIDLTLEWHERGKVNYVFIENKLKSLPHVSQVADYNKKIIQITKKKRKDTVKKIALAKFLLTPLPVNEELQSEFTELDWPNITYEDELLKFLHDIKKISFKNKDIPLVIDRYISFLDCLTALLHKFNLGQGNLSEFGTRGYHFYNYDPIEENDYPEENGKEIKLMSRIRDLRLHDLILKLAHQRLGELVRQKLVDRSANFVRSYKDLTQPGSMVISTNFTRSQGLTDIRFNIKGKFHMGLQLQGNSLRYLCEVYDKNYSSRNKDFARALYQEGLWFNDNSGNKLSGRGRDGELRIDDSTTFNSYGWNFIYLKKDMSEYHETSID
ncbi:MAG: PD-(D/E)XK nuclease family protein, partial [Flavobacteriales bacterium]|nr:PD-(D/E)XK nuclease family protein [Flavobacteriales bacterium]